MDIDNDWLTEERAISEHPFLPLTGDMGEFVVKFEGPPEKAVSNFSIDPDDPKYEWRFQVLHYEDPSTQDAPVRKIITESSENFLAQVTKVTEHGTVWDNLIGLTWKKQKASKSGRWFKHFDLTVVVSPFE